jgi:cellulose synthase/poly-beta-1,6-N-acetylglucosamine synthase-like glycosyltransferase
VLLILSVAAVALHSLCLARFALTPLLDLLLRRRPLPPAPPCEQWPPVSVHLAVYREHRILRELIQSVLDIDYPPESLTVLVLDDSTEEDAELTHAVAAAFASSGRVTYANRGSRAGFKAGALNHGLALTDCDLIAYFDADCRPSPSFLRRTVPYLHDPSVAAVQARWDFANAGASPRAQLQAAIFEWLFRFEITVRAKLALPSFYMGTAAVWRKSAIEAIGGWREEPFTAEDLDLSYRAGARGWNVAYQPEVVAATSAIEDVLAFRTQQRRWARTMLQAGADNFQAVCKARRPLSAKLFELTVGLAHGSGPALLLAIVMSMIALAAGIERTPAWIATQWALTASLLLSPVMVTLILAQRSYHPADWGARAARLFRALPEFIGLTTAFVFGLGDFLRAGRAEFVVTPKGGEVGVVGGSRRHWLSKHTLPAAFEVMVGTAASLAAAFALVRYPEAALPQALLGSSMLISFARTVGAMARHGARLRAQSPATLV